MNRSFKDLLSSTCQVSVERIVLDLESEAASVLFPPGVTFYHWIFSRSKASDVNIANFVNLRKTRVCGTRYLQLHGNSLELMHQRFHLIHLVRRKSLFWGKNIILPVRQTVCLDPHATFRIVSSSSSSPAVLESASPSHGF